MRALDAGCDVLLGPSHLDVARGHARALRARWTAVRGPHRAVASPTTQVGAVGGAADGFRRVSGSDVAWALQLSERVMHDGAWRRSAPEQGVPRSSSSTTTSSCAPLHPRTAFAQALEVVAGNCADRHRADRGPRRRRCTSRCSASFVAHRNEVAYRAGHARKGSRRRARGRDSRAARGGDRAVRSAGAGDADFAGALRSSARGRAIGACRRRSPAGSPRT